MNSNNTHTTIFSFFFCSAFAIALVYIYYVGYVGPRDEALRAIMACQIEINDMSYEGYEGCIQDLQRGTSQ